MRRQRQWSGVLLATLLIASDALADDTESRADAFFHDGVTAGQRGEYERSRAAFAASFALSPRGSTLRNMAVSEIQEGRVLDALKHLKEALGYADFASHRGLVQADMDAIYAEKVARIALDTDAGAQVTVDGAALAGSAPFKDAIDVLAGRHVLAATLGTRTAHVEVNATVGDVVHVDMHLPPGSTVAAPPAPASSSGVATQGSATAGASAAPSVPIRPIELSPPAPSGFWTGRRLAGASIGTAGLVAVGLAVGFQGAAGGAQSDGQLIASSVQPSGCVGPNRPQACTTLEDDYARQRSEADASRIFFALGGGALVAAATLLLWPSSPEPPRVAFVPVALPGGGGLQLQGEL